MNDWLLAKKIANGGRETYEDSHGLAENDTDNRSKERKRFALALRRGGKTEMVKEDSTMQWQGFGKLVRVRIMELQKPDQVLGLDTGGLDGSAQQSGTGEQNAPNPRQENAGSGANELQKRLRAAHPTPNVFWTRANVLRRAEASAKSWTRID